MLSERHYLFLVGVINGVKRSLLVSNQVILITDHSSLLALTTGKEMKSMRQQRYAMDLSEFNLEIVHRAGALLHTADALSRLGYT